MYKNRKILALIPARGGSKGLPDKNIRPLLKKPLIAWSIEQALKSRYIDKVVVTTDSPKIASVSLRYQAEVPFLRPKVLATDTASTMDVVDHAIDFLKQQGHEFDYILLIEPTSPLRADHDFDKAIVSLINNAHQADSLVSLGEVHMEHPSIVKKIIDGKALPYCANLKKVTRRQDLDKAYFPYGVVYLSKTASLLKTRSFYQKKTMPYLIERWQNYEVDDIYDFVCIEAILKERRGGK